MNRRATFWFIVALLIVLGLVTAVQRHRVTGVPWFPGKEQIVWLVEARVDFTALGGAVTASLSIPDSVPGYTRISEQAASPGYGFSIVADGPGRRAEWTRREASGPQSLYFTASFLPAPRGDGRREARTPAPQPEAVFWEEAEVTAASDLIARARETSSDDISLAREIAARLQAGGQNSALLRARGTGDAELLQKLFSDAGLPAREVLALELRDARRRQSLTQLLEVHDGERWVLFDPAAGSIETPRGLLLWHRSDRSLLDVVGGQDSRLSFSMIRQSLPAEQFALQTQEPSVFSVLGVQGLPIEEQSMFKYLLLLPLGAAVVVFFRVLIGMQTSGTFMPVLISLVFLQTSLLPGLISFTSVVMLGLLMRGYLSQLNLLLVARIAALVVLVIITISAMSIVGYQLGIGTGMTVTFFPMIIIAWTIERLSILWEEEGPKAVATQGGGSLLVAIIAYLFMQARPVQHLTFNFPELNLLLLAMILVMGQYTGYKLTELRRFADFQGRGPT